MEKRKNNLSEPKPAAEEIHSQEPSRTHQALCHYLQRFTSFSEFLHQCIWMGYDRNAGGCQRRSGWR